MRLGILFGGCSSEKEISLESGRHIYNSMLGSQYEIVPIFVDSKLKFWLIEEHLIWKNSTSDIEESCPSSAKRVYYEELRDIVDFCFLGLHGKYVEDGALQGLLEIIGIPYNGSRVIGAAIGMDKIFQKYLLKSAGLLYPPNVVIKKDSYANDPGEIERLIEDNIGFPCIVKPSREGCSTGISKIEKKANLTSAIEEAFRWDNTILVEKFMDFMEVTCTIIGNDDVRALAPTETPKKGDILTMEEKFLFGDAQMITPPRVSEKDINTMKAEFVKAYKALNLKVYARIDGFWDQNGKKLYINEPNTLPGLTPSTHVFHQAAEENITPQQLFERIIELSMEFYT